MRALLLALLVLAGCAEPDALDLGDSRTFAEAGLPLGPSGSAPEVLPPPGVVFDQDPLVPGTRVAFRVTGASPGDVVYFGRSSTGLGSGPCLSLPPVCLSLLPAIDLIGVTVADGTGTAEISVRLPQSVPPQFIYTQAVITGVAGSLATNAITAPVLAGGLDGDGDGYCDGSRCADPSAQPGDCNDDDPDAFPGQTRFFSAPHIDAAGVASYDFDCDGRERRQTSRQYSCTPGTILFCADHTNGWVGGVPSCGAVGSYATGCLSIDLGYGVAFCVEGNTASVAQSCR